MLSQLFDFKLLFCFMTEKVDCESRVRVLKLFKIGIFSFSVSVGNFLKSSFMDTETLKTV